MVDSTRSWDFLTNHAQVLVCIAHDPGLRLRDIAERVETTERAAHRIVAELANDGRVTRERTGAAQALHRQRPLPDPRPDRR
ncbi:MAG TPA: helix-turn-helix domain-containing protein [Solirubrobacteraceae bacterium]|nr:helix-turn-helix domain-containing protein [Solirubrobacteraceae bacterium]